MELWTASIVALWIVVALMAFLLVGALRQIGLFQLRLGEDMGALITDTGLDRGATGPDFEAIEIATGLSKRFSDLITGPSMLVFMTPSCLACRQLAPHLNEVIATRNDFRFAVVCSGDLASCRAFAHKYQFDTPVVLADTMSTVARSYEVKLTPLAYVLDEKRRVLIRGVANDWNQLESLLEQEGSLQAGRVWAKLDAHTDSAPAPGRGAMLAKE
jgi:methylamine dehydrogenase accessory protein MauD